MVTSGAQQVMDLTTKSPVQRGDVVICEAPSFIGSLNPSALRRAPAASHDDDGMNLRPWKPPCGKSLTPSLFIPF